MAYSQNGETMYQLKPDVYRVPEPGRFARIEFNFQVSERSMISIHVADCGVETLIGDLKVDLRDMFGDPANQEWFHRTKKLHDNKTLKYYDIDGRSSGITLIFVRKMKPDIW